MDMDSNIGFKRFRLLDWLIMFDGDGDGNLRRWNGIAGAWSLVFTGFLDLDDLIGQAQDFNYLYPIRDLASSWMVDLMHIA